jgi:hypothetical protein
MQFTLSPYSKRLVSGVHLAASATTADLLLRSTILTQPATVLRRGPPRPSWVCAQGGAQRFKQLCFSSDVERACCFVQNQQRRTVVKGACKTDALALPPESRIPHAPVIRVKTISWD